MSKEPLAKRLVCLGGCPPLLGQVQVQVADHIGGNITSALGLAGVPSNDVAQALLDLPIEDFWTKIPQTIPVIPVIDGDIIPTQITLETFAQSVAAMPGDSSVESIMVGDSKLDVSKDKGTIRVD